MAKLHNISDVIAIKYENTQLNCFLGRFGMETLIIYQNFLHLTPKLWDKALQKDLDPIIS